ncbi:hypothetical protein [Leptodesmis sp.]|uniref:hypothetical protein n=1 Tax=Leptodesmis sp. TaxID=3100501 RepID=UPI0040535768
MVVTPTPLPSQPTLKIRWEALPEDFKLDDEPVENVGQSLIAGALRESLELVGYIQPEMLIASNLGICATVNDNLVIKAPDWMYVARVVSPPPNTDRRSYQLVSPPDYQRYWLEPMNLFLGVWQGEKEGRSGYWLRWWDAAGNLLPWAVEQVEQQQHQLEQERQRAEQEHQRAQQERERAERLAAQLRSLGIDPDQV